MRRSRKASLSVSNGPPELSMVKAAHLSHRALRDYDSREGYLTRCYELKPPLLRVDPRTHRPTS